MTERRRPTTADDFDALRLKTCAEIQDDRVAAIALTMIDRDEKVEQVRAQIGTPPPCPIWCTVGAGHAYDLSDGPRVMRSHEPPAVYLTDEPIALVRYHYSDGCEEGAYLGQEERNENGVVTFGPVLVNVDEQVTEYVEVEGDGARQIAAALRRRAASLDLSADMFDVVTGVQT